jgi:hypothetical protein
MGEFCSLLCNITINFYIINIFENIVKVNTSPSQSNKYQNELKAYHN